MRGPNSGLNAYCMIRPNGNPDLSPCELIAGHRGKHWTPREKRSPVDSTEGVDSYYGLVDLAPREYNDEQREAKLAAKDAYRERQRALWRQSALGGSEPVSQSDAA